ncbi:MAG: GntR family transcriptional regulator, transcriptional repressor for pyruvate dehydrogenase complex [Pseudonocardiales bacterium]|jgi:GntR family transcriptional repressor for pyruvate dehydrogenase complex|nr:GntR family transcriptional regulator, transcriptional repressor for pyruvate dehydrogenase complex [Pseudonocardiales bacterium]
MTSHRLPDAVLRPLSDAAAFDSTVQRLSAVIRLGVFVHGEQLPPERELAVRLGVSRVNLREAIAALRESGMVQTRRGRGGGTTITYDGNPVRPLTPAEPDGHRALIVDALNFRRVVEPGAAYLAAGTELAGDQRDWLAGFEDQVRAAGNGSAHRIADSRLHLAIAALSGSPMLIEAVVRVQSSLDDVLGRLPLLPEHVEQSHQAHRAVVAAILDGDPPAARTEMERQCDATSELVRALLA